MHWCTDCHGIQRTEQAPTGTVIVSQQGGEPHFDINLMSPWYCEGVIEDALQQASWIKLNEDEFQVLKQQLKLYGDDEQVAIQLQKSYGLNSLLITFGEAGAWSIEKNEIMNSHSCHECNLVDTGDAFSAVVIYGITQG